LLVDTPPEREIECLSPDSLCFLSKNVGFPVFQDLAERWGAKEQVKFGELTTVNVGGSPIDAIATAWPGRGHEVLTRVHLQALFCHLGLAI
jgi:hypothetical protein